MVVQRRSGGGVLKWWWWWVGAVVVGLGWQRPLQKKVVGWDETILGCLMVWWKARLVCHFALPQASFRWEWALQSRVDVKCRSVVWIVVQMGWMAEFM